MEILKLSAENSFLKNQGTEITFFRQLSVHIEEDKYQ
jgi:hypothetical protein